VRGLDCCFGALSLFIIFLVRQWPKAENAEAAKEAMKFYIGFMPGSKIGRLGLFLAEAARTRKRFINDKCENSNSN
jgi:predicted 3-demethylubiquinone-9 3-methyltransferase (glyoxalase superfamily)